MREDTTEKKKPCPFCGSDDVQWVQSEWDFGSVECNKCDARGPIVKGFNQEQTEDEAIAKWNTLPQISMLETEIRQLKLECSFVRHRTIEECLQVIDSYVRRFNSGSIAKPFDVLLSVGGMIDNLKKEPGDK
jgi:Lar family restriction alleviation protein